MIDIKEKYQIIYADPPWKYGGNGGKQWHPASDYYPTMSFAEINAMRPDIDKIADPDNCLLFILDFFIHFFQPTDFFFICEWIRI